MVCLVIWFVFSISFVLLIDPEKPNKRNKPNSGLLKLGTDFLSGSNRMLGALYHMR